MCVSLSNNNMDYTTQDIINLIEVQAIVSQVNPQTALRIAMCESSLNPQARNPTSSAKGLYGFLDGTWQWIKAPMTQEDTYWSVVMFMKYYKKYPHYWECK